MTPNIQFRNCCVWDENTVSTVQYNKGQYTEIAQNPDQGTILVADGQYLNVSDNGTFSQSSTPQTFYPDYENRVLTFTSSFQYKNKIPYKGL